MQDFDMTDIFTAEVQPLLAQLAALCQKHGMPAVASVCHKHANGKDGQDGEDDMTTLIVGRDGMAPPDFCKFARVMTDGDPLKEFEFPKE